MVLHALLIDGVRYYPLLRDRRMTRIEAGRNDNALSSRMEKEGGMDSWNLVSNVVIVHRPPLLLNAEARKEREPSGQTRIMRAST